MRNPIVGHAYLGSNPELCLGHFRVRVVGEEVEVLVEVENLLLAVAVHKPNLDRPEVDKVFVV